MRFFENFLPVTELLFKGIIDIILSINGVLNEGNLLSLFALITAVASLPSAALVFQSQMAYYPGRCKRFLDNDSVCFVDGY